MYLSFIPEIDGDTYELTAEKGKLYEITYSYIYVDDPERLYIAVDKLYGEHKSLSKYIDGFYNGYSFWQDGVSYIIGK